MVFVVSLFFLKNQTSFKNNPLGDKDNGGLAYSSAVLENILERDSDSDGKLDWEEELSGTDPQNKDTDGDGVSDGEETVLPDEESGLDENAFVGDDAELSQTDKFSRELLATVAALEQTGSLDEASIEQLATSLAEQIATMPPQKVYEMKDLKVVAGTAGDFNSYNLAMDSAFANLSEENTVPNILNTAMTSEGDFDMEILTGLIPVIENTNKVIAGLAKAPVPQSLSLYHLNVLNDMQRISENMQNILSYESDAILAWGAIAQYEPNTAALEESLGRLIAAVQNGL